MSFFSRIFGGRNVEAPRVVIHEAFHGLIKVYGIPDVVDQEPLEEVREGDGFIVHVLKFRLEAEPMPLTLSAKVYLLHADAGVPEEPAVTDWSGLFGGLFAGEPEVSVSSVGQTSMTELVPAREARITGTARESGALLHIRERRSVRGQLQMIVTAAGPAELMEAHRDQVNQWFDAVAFDPSAVQ